MTRTLLFRGFEGPKINGVAEEGLEVEKVDGIRGDLMFTTTVNGNASGMVFLSFADCRRLAEVLRRYAK
jgi:hypothetical protein